MSEHFQSISHTVQHGTFLAIQRWSNILKIVKVVNGFGNRGEEDDVIKSLLSRFRLLQWLIRSGYLLKKPVTKVQRQILRGPRWEMTPASCPLLSCTHTLVWCCISPLPHGSCFPSGHQTARQAGRGKQSPGWAGFWWIGRECRVPGE